MKHFIPFSMLLLTVTTAHAQLNPTMYHMKDLPLNTQLNPAFQPRNGSIYIGFPALTSFSPSVMLSGEDLTLGNVYLSPAYKAIVMGAGDFSSLNVGYEHNILNFGFMVKDMYFTFDSKLKLSVEGRIPKALERLMWYGNGAPETLGKAISMEGLGVSTLGYGEISLGMSKEIQENLFVGAKIKYLQGLANVQAELGDGSRFITAEDTYKISVGFNPEIFISGLPVTVPKGNFSIDSLTGAGFGNYSFDAGNRGLAFDLGGSWDLPWVKGLNVSASVLDIGYIKWSGHKIVPVNPPSPGNEIEFEGISLSGSDDFASSLIDSIQQKTAVRSTSTSERRWLSPTVYVGANYELWKYLNAGALFGYKFSKYESSPLVALSVNTQGFMVNLSAAYSYYNRNSNVGVGILFGRKALQWHIIADNLLAVNYKTAQNVNFRMGLNFLFGKGREKRSKLPAESNILVPTDEPTDTITLSMRQLPIIKQTDTLKITPDSGANPDAALDTVNVQDTIVNVQDTVKNESPDSTRVENSTKDQQAGLSKEDLLRRAMREEIEDGDAIKRQAGLSREDLLRRAIREEMEDKNAIKSKPGNTKLSAEAKPVSKKDLLAKALREEAEEKNAKAKKK
ncbi:MAG: DUF5723 family protein [Prevotellaceae bacterium]|jgi:hypothetical protein|nr:DUF5723 family protein [Prevotellaceae bacterium]